MHENFVESVYYAQTIETECARIQKELINLQYLNKFLLITQKKKDDMISYLFEENRALKNEVVELGKKIEKVKNYKIKNKKAANNTVGEKFLDISFTNVNHKIINTPTSNNYNNPHPIPGKKSSTFIPNASLVSELLTKRRTKVIEDNLTYKNLLNMNLSNYFFYLFLWLFFLIGFHL